MKKIAVLLLSVILACSTFACGGDTDGMTKINLLTTGWINTPTDNNDPYKKWIKDNYELDVSLNTTSDFNNSATIAFASNDKPDLISFPDLTQFGKITNQGVLLDDWTPFLDKMPKMKAFLDSPEQAFLKQLFTKDGKLTAIWTNPNAVTWSLKIREDWATEYRKTTTGGTTIDGKQYPAGNLASTDPVTKQKVAWQPYTPEDLLNFSRWIKVTKNSNSQGTPDYFGFSTSGGGNSFGVMGTWLPIMFGYHYLPPYGIYVDPVTNEPNFGVTDGTFEQSLNYMKSIVSEKLIDPNWFIQSQNDDMRTKQGKIGIQWMPGIIAETTANYNVGVDTTDWWKTYNIPKANADSPIGGVMMNDSIASAIISVSAKTALNSTKMDKICKLLDDLVCYVDSTKTGPEQYVRGEAYDALRWGVGVDADLKYEQVEGTDFKYICVKTGKTYRESLAGVGSWDWGSWFSTTNDGIVQGEAKTISNITKKSIELNVATAQLKSTTQVGSFLSLDQTKIYNMNVSLVDYQYKYVTGVSGIKTMEQYKQYWKKDLYGDSLLAEAKNQFKSLGLIK